MDLGERIEAAKARQPKGEPWVEYENIYGANATEWAKYLAERLNSEYEIDRRVHNIRSEVTNAFKV